MCTSINLKSKDGFSFFGRNMDIEYEFNQKVILIPKNFEALDKVNNKTNKGKYSILGMGTVIANYPLMADGFNSEGLGVAGLNFPHHAHYNEYMEGSINIAAYDFTYYILANFKSVKEVRSIINNVNLVNKPFLPNLPLATLHWIISDKEDSIVVEQTKDGLKAHENPLKILSNSPTFDWHMTNLKQYIGLSSKNPSNTKWGNVSLEASGQGLGLRGIPGDLYPASRFVRAAYLTSHVVENNTYDETLATFFHILNNLAMVDSSVITHDDKVDTTIYQSCMCFETKTYFYKTKKNFQLNAICMDDHNLEDTNLKEFEYINTNNINKQTK